MLSSTSAFSAVLSPSFPGTQTHADARTGEHVEHVNCFILLASLRLHQRLHPHFSSLFLSSSFSAAFFLVAIEREREHVSASMRPRGPVQSMSFLGPTCISGTTDTTAVASLTQKLLKQQRLTVVALWPDTHTHEATIAFTHTHIHTRTETGMAVREDG